MFQISSLLVDEEFGYIGDNTIFFPKLSMNDQDSVLAEELLSVESTPLTDDQTTENGNTSEILIVVDVLN